MTVRRWLPVFLYLLGLGYFLVQLFLVRHQLPARIVMIPHAEGRPDGGGDTKSFIIFLALASLFAPVPFSGTFWRLRSKKPTSLNMPRKNYWQQPENWRGGCDSLFFSSFWLALAQIVYLMGWFSLVVQANQRQPPSIDGGSLHILLICCMAMGLAWVVYAAWFIYRPLADAGRSGW